MKKLIVLAVAVLASAAFTGVNAASKKKKDKEVKQPVVEQKLNTAADSLSYAAGMARTDGLLPYLQTQVGVDTAYMADFIQSFSEVMEQGTSPKMKARMAGQQIAMMALERMLPYTNKEFKAVGDSIDTKLFAKGFTDAVGTGSKLMSVEAAKTLFEQRSKQAIETAKEANKKAGEDFLVANAKKAGVVTLPSGLQYKVITEGKGEKATADDEVTVKYEGRLVDGTVFDSSEKHNTSGTAKFRPAQVIKGWQEALTLMPVGSKWELYIPYNLAYGERAAGAQIQPYSALVFTVELIKAEKSEAKTLPAPAKGAKPVVTAAKTAKKQVKKSAAKKK